MPCEPKMAITLYGYGLQLCTGESRMGSGRRPGSNRLLCRRMGAKIQQRDSEPAPSFNLGSVIRAERVLSRCLLRIEDMRISLPPQPLSLSLSLSLHGTWGIRFTR